MRKGRIAVVRSARKGLGEHVCPRACHRKLVIFIVVADGKSCQVLVVLGVKGLAANKVLAANPAWFKSCLV